MNIHFLTRSNEIKTVSLEGQITFFSQKSVSSEGQMLFHLTFGGKKNPRKVKFDLQRLDLFKGCNFEILPNLNRKREKAKSGVREPS